MVMISAPRATEVKLVRLAENAAEATINALLAEGMVMMQCVGSSNVMVLLRYATPMFEGRMEVRIVRLGDVSAEERINQAITEDFMPMGHVGAESQYLLLSRMVDAPKRPRARAVPSDDEISGATPASMEGLPTHEDDPEHDAEACPACNPRIRRDN